MFYGLPTKSRKVSMTSLAVITSMIFCISCLLIGLNASAKKTKVTFMAWVTMKADNDCFNRMVAAFEKEHPNIDVKFVAETWTGEIPYFSKFLAMAMAGVAPDVVMIPYNYIPNFAEANVIEDLSPWVKKSKLKLSDYTNAGIQSASWKGRLWGLNSGTSSDYWIMYNKKLIAEAGMIDPGLLASRGDWNWNNMQTIMVKTSRFDGNKMIRVGLNQMADIPAIASWIYGMGGRIMNDDGTECTLNEPAAIEAVSMIRDLIYSKRCMGLAWAPPYNLDHITSGTRQQYTMIAWWNTLATFLTSQKVPWPLDMVPFPAGPRNSKDIVCTIHSMCISRQSKVKNEAWELVRFLGGTEGQTICADDLQGIPTKKDVVKHFAQFVRNQGYSGGAFVEDEIARQKPMERSVRWNQVYPKINDQLSKIWGGKADVAMSLKDAVKSANLILGRGKKK